ncbi:MAG TPA: energy transducer TonB [Terriglobales bacterium]|nr:energy transducer TonB [Terriglobales bacterium]
MDTHATIEHEESAQAMSEVSPLVGMRLPDVALRQKILFEHILLETSGEQRNRRRFATLLSVVLQCFLVAVLILVPLWFTDVLPKQQLVTFLVAPSPPPPPPNPAAPAPAIVRVVKPTSDIMNGQLRTPDRIPNKVQMIREEEAPPSLNVTGEVVGGVPNGILGGQLGGVIGGIISSTSKLAVVPEPKAAIAKRVRVSQGVSQGLLIYRVEPKYPPIAQQAHIQGIVILTAVIGKDGIIQRLQLVSGHPMLATAAIDAVKQWRYKPYLLNGQPVEAETTVAVTFRLQR